MTTERQELERAILHLARDRELLAQFQADPVAVGASLGVDADWSQSIADGDRDRLRSAGLNDGTSILVTRWFRSDLEDADSTGTLQINTSPLPPADVPSQLVFAGGCSHVPDLLARPEIDPADSVGRLSDGYQQLGKILAAAEPDVLVVTADCHFQSFASGAFVVGSAARHAGSMSFFGRPDLDLELTGDPEFADQLIRAVRAENLEVEDAATIDLDHGLIVPLRLLLPRTDLPVVPIITQPARSFSPFGARVFGGVLRSVTRSSNKRVAMLATGGLSHWLDPGKYGHIDVEFDTYILEMLQAGHGLDIANLEPFALLSHGQYEFLNWIIMLSLVGEGVCGEVLAYEPMTASGGGWTVVNMLMPGHDD